MAPTLGVTAVVEVEGRAVELEGRATVDADLGWRARDGDLPLEAEIDGGGAELDTHTFFPVFAVDADEAIS